MRKLKFRAWDKVDKVMHLSSISEVGIDFEGLIYYSECDGLRKFKPEFQERFVIMQFTGLKDKNGKEIFEGDIIKMMSESIGQVKYEYDCFAIYLSAKGLKEHIKTQNPSMWINCEIIGNIYENKELLK